MGKGGKGKEEYESGGKGKEGDDDNKEMRKE